MRDSNLTQLNHKSRSIPFYILTGTLRVILALTLRDIKTRAGSSYFGFIFGLVMPLGHILIVLGIYIAIGRKSGIGTDVTLFLCSAILPFILWSYTHQKISLAFSQNSPLTNFPIVRYIDIMIARSVVELLSGTLVSLVVFFVVLLIDEDIFIYNEFNLVFYLIIAYVFGISTGFIFGILGLVSQIYIMIGFLLIPLFWLTSGVLFLPGSIPTKFQAYMYMFPLAHIVDLSRIAIFPAYSSNFPDIRFVLCIIAFNFLSGMAALRFAKNSINKH